MKNRIFQLFILSILIMLADSRQAHAQQAVSGLLLPKVEQLNKGDLSKQDLHRLANELERIAWRTQRIGMPNIMRLIPI